jgi:hypothetical protein
MTDANIFAMNKDYDTKDVDGYVENVNKFLKSYDDKRENAEKQIIEYDKVLSIFNIQQKLLSVIKEKRDFYEKQNNLYSDNPIIKYEIYDTKTDLLKDIPTTIDDNIASMKIYINNYIKWYCDLNKEIIKRRDLLGVSDLINNSRKLFLFYTNHYVILEENIKMLTASQGFFSFKNNNITKLRELLKNLQQTFSKYDTFITDITKKYIHDIECDIKPYEDLYSIHSVNRPSPTDEEVAEYREIMSQNKQTTSTYGALYKNLDNPIPTSSTGGNPKVKKTTKKEILGKERCIYKISGDRKEYVKYKGDLITLKDYKNIMKRKK